MLAHDRLDDFRLSWQHLVPTDFYLMSVDSFEVVRKKTIKLVIRVLLKIAIKQSMKDFSKGNAIKIIFIQQLKF